MWMKVPQVIYNFVTICLHPGFATLEQNENYWQPLLPAIWLLLPVVFLLELSDKKN
jgi:hypothetical protein